MPARDRIISTLLSLVGAVVGGALGYFLFFWIERQGFYAMIAPGALMGLGCGLLARHRSYVRGLICGVAAFFLGLYTEWSWKPLGGSFTYLATHLSERPRISVVMILVGALIAFWLGKDGGYSGTYPDLRPKKPTSS